MRAIPVRNLVVLAVAGCLALVILQLHDHGVAAAVAKVIASTAFVAVAIRLGAPESGYGRLILLGLVFSWFGDVFLIGQTQSFFLPGLGAFLLAHVAYITAFVARGISPRWIAAATLPVAAVGIAVLVWLAPYTPPGLVIPVRAYTIVICLMVIAAIGTRGRGATLLIVAGALMFFVSDLSVAALRLVQTGLPTYLLGLPLYYAGQLCLAASVSHSRPR